MSRGLSGKSCQGVAEGDNREKLAIQITKSVPQRHFDECFILGFLCVNDSPCAVIYVRGLSGRSCQGSAECDTLEKYAIEITKLDPGAKCVIVKICFVTRPRPKSAESQIRLVFFPSYVANPHS